MYGGTCRNQQGADGEELSSIYGVSEVDSGSVERPVTVANRTGLANYREFQPERWVSSYIVKTNDVENW
jgi:hypothetical protein